MSQQEHLNEDRFLAFVLGDLTGRAKAEIELHLEGCADCREVVELYFSRYEEQEPSSQILPREKERRLEAFLAGRLGQAMPARPPVEEEDGVPEATPPPALPEALDSMEAAHRSHRFEELASLFKQAEPAVRTSDDAARARLAYYSAALEQRDRADEDTRRRTKELIDFFTKDVERRLFLRDYLYVQMAKGLQRLVNGEYSAAEGFFVHVRSHGASALPEPDMYFLATANLVRAVRYQGHYRTALDLVTQAENDAGQWPIHLAVVKVMKSWIEFSLNPSYSVATMVADTDLKTLQGKARIEYANWLSILVRVHRRNGQLALADTVAKQAAAEFRQAWKGEQQPSYARLLLNWSMVLSQSGHAAEAEEQLARAAKIYEDSHDKRGQGMVSLYRAQSALANKALEKAKSHIQPVLEMEELCPPTTGPHWGVPDQRTLKLFADQLKVATDRDVLASFGLDGLLVTRALLLRCRHAWELAADWDYDSDTGYRPARFAADAALAAGEAALELAKAMDSDRLRCRAHTWLGFSLLLQSRVHWKTAKRWDYAARADEQLTAALEFAGPNPVAGDYVWEEVGLLKAEVMADQCAGFLRLGDDFVRGRVTSLDDLIARLHEQVLSHCIRVRNGNLSETADDLDIGRGRLNRILKAIGGRVVSIQGRYVLETSPTSGATKAEPSASGPARKAPRPRTKTKKRRR